MFSVTDETLKHFVALKISGKLSTREYANICTVLQEAARQHEHVDLLWQFEDFRGWNLFVLWKAAIVATRDEINLRRVAVVGERKWHSWTRPLVRGFHGDTRYFEPRQRLPALRWVRTGQWNPGTGGRVIGRVRRFDRSRSRQR